MDKKVVNIVSLISILGTALSLAVLVSTHYTSYTAIPVYTWLLQFVAIATFFLALVSIDKAYPGKGITIKVKAIAKSSFYGKALLISFIVIVAGVIAFNVSIYNQLGDYIKTPDTLADIEKRLAHINMLHLRASSVIWLTLYYISLVLSQLSYRKS